MKIFHLNFSLEELTLFFINIIFSLVLFLSPKKLISSYVLENEDSNKYYFYYEYRNRLGFRSYTKRPVSEIGKEEKVKAKEFNDIKSNLIQRAIP